MDSSYEKAAKALKLTIVLQRLAIILGFIFMVFCVLDAIKILSIIGMLKDGIGHGIIIFWPAFVATIVSFFVMHFRFLPAIKVFFDDPSHPVTKFGQSTDDEEKEFATVRKQMVSYILFLIGVSATLVLLHQFPFLNILITAMFLLVQSIILMFYKDIARLLKADTGLVVA